MRQILFKAKRKDNGEWVEGYYLNVAKINHFICTGKIKLDGALKGIIAPEMYAIDPDTLCQYTGLTDKNGKRIWENDIVRFQFDNDDCPFPNKDTKKRLGKIFFSDFRVSWSIAMGRKGDKTINNDLFKYVQNGNRVEVIGNIFDNAELLEVE